MNNREKEHDQFSEVWREIKSADSTSRTATPQSRTPSRPGQHLSPKQIRAKRRRNRQRNIAIASAVALALLLLAIVLICKSCARDKDALGVLAGVWHYDQYTEYEFDGKGNGCICLDQSTHFEFTYKVKGDTLYLDFALDYVTDCRYTYTVDGDKLTLVGGEGTAEVGRVYELTLAKEE